MPKLKQVVPLHSMVLDAFLESVLQCFKRLIGTGDRALFRRGVISIRERVECLPESSLFEFAERFLTKFIPGEYDKSDYQIGLEIIMDIEIAKLRLVGRNLNPLILREGHRFPRLKELDTSTAHERSLRPMSLNLSILNLKDLTTFIYPDSCTDSDLIIIGEHCRNLEVLNVSYSKHVTDEGLAAISPCLNLRVVHFCRCNKLTHRGFNDMLSVHKKLEDFYYRCSDISKSPLSDSNTDVSSGLDPSVDVLTLNRLDIESSRNGRPALNLQVIVNKFPNLINLRIHCKNLENIPALKYLNRLTGLGINFIEGFRSKELKETWGHLEDLFMSIGPNITHLTLGAKGAEFTCGQEKLDMIFDRCRNLEHLEFDYDGRIAVVPEFTNLKVLTPHTVRGTQDFQFGKMLNLEILTLHDDIDRSMETVKSIMFDNDKFPKLSVLKVTSRSKSRIGKEVERIAKDSNLDFRVEEHDRFFHIIGRPANYFGNVLGYLFSPSLSYNLTISPRIDCFGTRSLHDSLG